MTAHTFVNLGSTAAAREISIEADGNFSVLLENVFAQDTDKDCVATIVTDTCTIRAATVEYSLTGHGGRIVLEGDRFPTIKTIAPSPNDLPADDGAPVELLTGIQQFGNFYLQSNVTLSNGISSTNTFGTTQSAYYDPPDLDKAENTSCPDKWISPTNNILWALLDVTFRVAAFVGNESDPPTTWNKTFTVATGVMLFGVLLATTLFWECWKLGREVSLSPLETGRALAEVILEPPEGRSDMDIYELLKVMGGKDIKKVE